MANGGLFGAIGVILQALPVTVRIKRSLESFTADAVIEEHAEDTVVVTSYPIEQGAVISDHAYNMPTELNMEYVWSMGSKQNAFLDPSFLSTMYQKLLQLKTDRTLFDVVTGKRVYHNMILTRVTNRTDKDSENILAVRVSCQEILMATTQIVTVSNAAVQTLPQKTAGTLDQGFVNLVPGNNFNATSPVSQ